MTMYDALWFLAGLGAAYAVEWLRARHVPAADGSPRIPDGCVYLEDAADGQSEWYAVTLKGVTTRYAARVVCELSEDNVRLGVTSEYGVYFEYDRGGQEPTEITKPLTAAWNLRRVNVQAARRKAALPPLPDMSKLTSGHGRVTVVEDP